MNADAPNTPVQPASSNVLSKTPLSPCTASLASCSPCSLLLTQLCQQSLLRLQCTSHGINFLLPRSAFLTFQIQVVLSSLNLPLSLSRFAVPQVCYRITTGPLGPKACWCTACTCVCQYFNYSKVLVRIEKTTHVYKVRAFCLFLLL